MMRKLSILLLLVLLLLTRHAGAQNEMLVTGTFEQVSFSRFVAQIEASSPYRFFYTDKGLDSFEVNVTAREAKLSALLQKVFEGTIYKYAIDVANVYITRGVQIHTTLAEGYFNRGGNNTGNNLLATNTTGKSAGATTNTPIIIGNPAQPQQKTSVTIAGYVRQKKNGEGIPGALVFLDSLSTAVVTDQFGYYSITLTPGRHTLRANSSGTSESNKELMVYGDGKLNLELEEQVSSLRDVTIFSSRNTQLRSSQMGMERLSIRTIKQIPVVLGEVDVLRVVLALPGVTSVGEASTGFNVRGGAASQNLVLYNGATIYNPAHLFGFFASFNPDMIKGVELYKSSIPEKYGGRISSVLDVASREGNQKNIAGSAGIGLLTSKFALEGPLVKDRTTFLLGGRTTYSNWLLKQLKKAAYRNSEASFYDADLHLQHRINDRNSLFLTAYLSQDGFKLNNDTAYAYGNRNINLKWRHAFSNRFTGVLAAGIDRYGYDVSSKANKVNAFLLQFNIQQKLLRADFNYAPNNRHALGFGIGTIAYKLQPGTIEPAGRGSLVQLQQVETEKALETALYFGDQFTVNPKLSVAAGLRFSMYQYLGAQKVYRYVEGLPRSSSTVADSTVYGKGKIIRNWMGPEVRLSARYSIASRTAVKLSFNTLRQYIHMLSNTAAISPVDVWKLSDQHIRPQQGGQVSLGVYQNSKSNNIEASLEVYYRRIRHFLDYKSGAVLVLNEQVERDVINTKGRAYGAELMIKKSNGKLNGWIAYTYSRSLLRQDDLLAGENINEGREYPADFDKPHNLNMITNYRFSHRFSASMNTVYSTGRPITLPIGVFELGGSRRLLYGDRNSHRIPNYFRIDLSFSIEGNHRLTKKTHNSWSFGVYNLNARKNVYSVYFVQEGGQIKGYQLSIFGTAIPFITYNIRF